MTHVPSPPSACSSPSRSTLLVPLADAAGPLPLPVPAAALACLCAALRRSAASLRCLHGKDAELHQHATLCLFRAAYVCIDFCPQPQHAHQPVRWGKCHISYATRHKYVPLLKAACMSLKPDDNMTSMIVITVMRSGSCAYR